METNINAKNYTPLETKKTNSFPLRNILLYSCILIVGIFIGVVLTSLNSKMRSSEASSDQKINSVIRVVPPKN